MQMLEVKFPSWVTVSLQVGQTENSPKTIRFIWGIGMNGLTDFEIALSQKAKGRQIRLPLDPKTVPAMFEHLSVPVLSQISIDQPVQVTARIVTIEAADNRDVVKAMAGLREGGCGGGCGCGCGS